MVKKKRYKVIILITIFLIILIGVSLFTIYKISKGKINETYNKQYSCDENICIKDWKPKGCMPIIGTMANNGNIKTNPIYIQAFESVFTHGFVSGIPKFWFILPDVNTNLPFSPNRPPLSEDDFNFKAIDSTFKIFNDRNYEYDVYHSIVVHQDDELPNWYLNLPTNEDRRMALETHVRTLTGHIDDEVPIIVVVNHPYNKPWRGGNLENNYMRTGWNREESFINIFQWADEENSDALLIMNEGGDNNDGGGVATNPEKTQRYVNEINGLRSQGVPVEGIGIMGHYGWGDGKLPSDETLREVFSILNNVGIPIYITELDISYDWLPENELSNFNPEDEFIAHGMIFNNYWDYQAYALGHVIQIADEYENIRGIYLWGMRDGVSDKAWRIGAGILFNNLDPKPAYYVIKELVEISEQNTCSLT